MSFRMKTKHKYGAKSVDKAGMSFSSKGESGLYSYLKLLEAAGEIKVLKSQDWVYLTKSRIGYIADFKIFDKKLNCEVWCEFKGFETPEWRIKRRLWMNYGPGELRVYKGYGTRLSLTETIVPKQEGESNGDQEKDQEDRKQVQSKDLET